MKHIKLIGIVALLIGVILIGLASVGLSSFKEANACNDAAFSIQLMEKEIADQVTCDRYQVSSAKALNEALLRDAKDARVQGDCEGALQLARSIDTTNMCSTVLSNSYGALITPPVQELDVSWLVIGILFILSIVLVMLYTILHHH